MAQYQDLVRATVRAACVQLSEELLEVILHDYNLIKNKRRSWVRRETLLKDRAIGDTESYINQLCMSEENFEILLQKITPKIQKQNTLLRDALPARQKLQVTLRYLASGDTFVTLSRIYGMVSNSISQFIPQVCEAIYECLEEYIQAPKTEQEWKSVQDDFYNRWNFPNCLGALDAKHILIRCPSISGSEHFNTNHSLSLILTAVATADYCFSYIDLGVTGHVNDDSRVFSKCSLYESLEQNVLNLPTDGFFVADDAFPLRMDILTPYSTTVSLTASQQIFNYRLSRARQVVENSFGILTSRFRIYEKPIYLAIHTVPKIVKATCALHNWLLKTSECYIQRGSVDVEDIEKGFINCGSWRQSQPNGIAKLVNYGSNNYMISAGVQRNMYAEKFMTTEAVSWQTKMVNI